MNKIVKKSSEALPLIDEMWFVAKHVEVTENSWRLFHEITSLVQGTCRHRHDDADWSKHVFNKNSEQIGEFSSLYQKHK